MPYKRTSIPFESMARLLKGYGLNAPELAKVLGVSAPTAREKLKDPGRLTLRDLAKINSYGHISIEVIREAIRE